MNTPKNRSKRNFLVFAIAGRANAAPDHEIRTNTAKILASAVLDLALKQAAEQKRHGWLCGTYFRSLREGLHQIISDNINNPKQLVCYCQSICSGCCKPEAYFENQINWLLENTPTIHINQHNTKLYEKSILKGVKK